jgi:hypothetical protein
MLDPNVRVSRVHLYRARCALTGGFLAEFAYAHFQCAVSARLSSQLIGAVQRQCSSGELESVRRYRHSDISAEASRWQVFVVVLLKMTLAIRL